MSYTKQKIEVRTLCGAKFRKTAFVKGCFAIHTPLESHLFVYSAKAITHVPTGILILYAYSTHGAKYVIDYLIQHYEEQFKRVHFDGQNVFHGIDLVVKLLEDKQFKRLWESYCYSKDYVRRQVGNTSVRILS